MKPELRDYFAVHFAAALASEQRYALEFIAGRAYDLAEAMLEERARRIEAELSYVGAEERESLGGPLLDEMPPPSERDIDDDEMIDSDDGPLFAAARAKARAAAEAARPGLARTQPGVDERGRSTGS